MLESRGVQWSNNDVSIAQQTTPTMGRMKVAGMQLDSQIAAHRMMKYASPKSHGTDKIIYRQANVQIKILE